MLSEPLCAVLLAASEIVRLSSTPSSAPAVAAQKLSLTRAISGINDSASLLGDITMVLFEYQKMAGKEAREDTKMSTGMKELAEQQKAAKLQNDNREIEKQMEEASQKAQNLFDAAYASLGAGIVSGATAVASNHWEPLVSHLRAVQATLRGFRQRTPIPGTRPAAAGPGLQPSIDRFVQLQKRLAATSKWSNDELRKLERR